MKAEAPAVAEGVSGTWVELAVACGANIHPVVASSIQSNTKQPHDIAVRHNGSSSVEPDPN